MDLPEGIKPEVQPPYGPTGEVYRYTLKSNIRNIRELYTIQDWVIDRQFKSVPGVADVNSFGGEERSFERAVNPDLLLKYGYTKEEWDKKNISSNWLGFKIITELLKSGSLDKCNNNKEYNNKNIESMMECLLYPVICMNIKLNSIEKHKKALDMKLKRINRISNT